MAASETLLSSLILKGSSELVTMLVKAYAKRIAESNIENVSKLKSNIIPHIDATFNKCKTIKTLLNPQTPADFLAIYATQRFQAQNRLFDHYGMVDYVRNKANNIIIAGSGGSGKSMFTRYLWLSLFVHSDGKIPLFIELRNINNINTGNNLNESLLSYIHASIS
jgi:Cdc6-like AAA superfamily ATPase